jgi:hypothetical protein
MASADAASSSGEHAADVQRQLQQLSGLPKRHADDPVAQEVKLLRSNSFSMLQIPKERKLHLDRKVARRFRKDMAEVKRIAAQVGADVVERLADDDHAADAEADQAPSRFRPRFMSAPDRLPESGALDGAAAAPNESTESAGDGPVDEEDAEPEDADAATDAPPASGSLDLLAPPQPGSLRSDAEAGSSAAPSESGSESAAVNSLSSASLLSDLDKDSRLPRGKVSREMLHKYLQRKMHDGAVNGHGRSDGDANDEEDLEEPTSPGSSHAATLTADADSAAASRPQSSALGSEAPEPEPATVLFLPAPAPAPAPADLPPEPTPSLDGAFVIAVVPPTPRSVAEPQPQPQTQTQTQTQTQPLDSPPVAPAKIVERAPPAPASGGLFVSAAPQPLHRPLRAPPL